MNLQHIEKRIQKRYPMIHLIWKSGTAEVTEIYEKQGRKHNRFLWAYQNHDGSRTPIIYDTVMAWLLAADTRHWGDRDLFKQIIDGRKKATDQATKEFRNKVEAMLIDDYNYIADIPTFFMDPSSCPEWKRKYRPTQADEMKKAGLL